MLPGTELHKLLKLQQVLLLKLCWMLRQVQLLPHQASPHLPPIQAPRFPIQKPQNSGESVFGSCDRKERPTRKSFDVY